MNNPQPARPHPSFFWSDWGTRDFDALRIQGRLDDWVAVLPVAATEQHGPHLPVKVDTALVDGVIAAAIPHLTAQHHSLFLPTLPVGFSPEHSAYAGTLTLKAETVLRLWTDIGDSVAASGFKKMVLFNAHGGQVGLMDVVARDLRVRHGMLVFSVNWYDLPLIHPQGVDVRSQFSAHEHRFGIHAGDIETSMMLALDGANVRMELADNFVSQSEQRAKNYAILGNGRSAKLGWQIQDYHPAGAVGHSAAATIEKGQYLIEAAGSGLAQLLAEVQHMPPPQGGSPGIY